MAKKKPKTQSIFLPVDKKKNLFRKVEVKKGRLHGMLRLPKSEKFKLDELKKLQGVDIGKSFKFHGNDFKMTPLLKKRINFAVMLMSKSKAKRKGGSLDPHEEILSME